MASSESEPRTHRGIARAARAGLVALLVVLAGAGATLVGAASASIEPVSATSLVAAQGPCGDKACAPVPANQGPCGAQACAPVPANQSPCGDKACAPGSIPGLSTPAPPTTQAATPATSAPTVAPPAAGVTSTTDGGFRAGRPAPGLAAPKNAAQSSANWVLPVTLLAVAAAVFVALVVRHHRRRPTDGLFRD